MKFSDIQADDFHILQVDYVQPNSNAFS